MFGEGGFSGKSETKKPAGGCWRAFQSHVAPVLVFVMAAAAGAAGFRLEIALLGQAAQFEGF